MAEMDEINHELANRWREGQWCQDPKLHPGYAPMHVKEAFYFGWSKHFAILPVRLVNGRHAWLRTVERRQVHAPSWFGHIASGWNEYRELPVKAPSDAGGGA